LRNGIGLTHQIIDIGGDPYGNRTRVSAVKEPVFRPIAVRLYQSLSI
jgi:hypothetical protein